MKESGYYPPGAEFDPNAPYNEISIPEKEFEVTITQTLDKTVKVSTSDYIIEQEGEHSCINTEDTDWLKVYMSNHETLPKLLAILRSYILKDLEYGDSRYSKKHLEYLLQECEDWIETDIEVIEE